MDFLADENVPRPIIERLRRDGFTAHTVAEKWPGIGDSHVLAVASEGGLILITQDQDFGELAIVRQAPVTGVVLLELARLPLNAQVERTARFFAANRANLAGKLTVIEPARVRVRALPKS